MEAQHAPDEWTCEQRDSSSFAIRSDTDGLITVVCDDPVELQRDRDRSLRLEARARLIASAPSLLAERDRLAAALRRVLSAIEWSTTSDRMSEKEMADLIRSALASLTGGN